MLCFACVHLSLTLCRAMTINVNLKWKNFVSIAFAWMCCFVCCFNMCMHVWVHVCVFACACMHMCGDDEIILGDSM